MNHVWIRFDALLLKKKEDSWNDWYFQFDLVFETILWSARSNDLSWNFFSEEIYFLCIWVYLMFEIESIIRHTLASVIHNYYKIRKNDTFVLLHFCTTTTVIYFKSVRSHHGDHKLLHGILCNILFWKKSFFENI